MDIEITFDDANDPRLVRGQELARSMISSAAFRSQERLGLVDTSLVQDILKETTAQDGLPDWALIVATLIGLQELGASLAHAASAAMEAPIEVVMETAIKILRKSGEE